MRFTLIFIGGMIFLAIADFLISFIADAVHFLRTGRHRDY